MKASELIKQRQRVIEDMNKYEGTIFYQGLFNQYRTLTQQIKEKFSCTESNNVDATEITPMYTLN